ncbi:purple acid phosphatase family protein [Gayadomonas joobiniege]|uniref:purple acid phosphatase family protein n=1 Tax=Gayadomonas joobiniege TaxID=1234606 RepID=UPI000474AEA9|nr:metallophosphoesterase family protein [Gayadomonas joobiniege]
MNKINRIVLLMIVVIFSSKSNAHGGHHQIPPWQAPTTWPDRIVATVTNSPSDSFSVNWRTSKTVGVALAEIVPATADARFDLNAKTVKATSELFDPAVLATPEGQEDIVLNQGLDKVVYHSVTFSGLKPDTLYAYRVRGEVGKWSAWYQVKTAPSTGHVKAVFFGDAQTGIRSHVSRTIAAAAKVAPDADLLIHGGDLVNTAEYDQEWAEWFDAGGRSYRMVPSLLVPGNHDYVNFSVRKGLGKREGGKLFVADKTVTPWWRAQFTLPIEKGLPLALHETVYAILYNDNLHIFAIDSSGIEFDKQMKWLAKELAMSKAKWRIVTMHHPLFSFVGGSEHPAAKERRLLLANVLAEHDVDLVLTGHRHTYQRAEKGENLARFNVGQAHQVDTVFVVTASSTKRGDTKVEGWDRFSEQTKGEYALTRYANKTPIFAVVEIDEKELRFAAYDPVGNLYDAFSLNKKGKQKTIKNHAAASGPIRDGDALGPYKKWDDLRH